MPGMTITAEVILEFTKTLVLVDLTMDVFDPDSDIISGTADLLLVGKDVLVNVGNESGGANMTVQVSADGDWLANFKGIFDITDDMGAHARIFDEDNNYTVAEPEKPPYIVGRANIDQIVAVMWPEGENVTIFVDFDDDLGNGYLYTDTQTSEIPEPGWPEPPVALFELESFDLLEGHFITASGAGKEKVLELTHIEITEVDINTEIVTGTADPDDKVTVYSRVPVYGWIVGQMEEGADELGYWTADFSAAGMDIWYGLEVTAGKQPDEDGDISSFVWIAAKNPAIGTNGAGWFIPQDAQNKVKFGFDLRYKKDNTLKGSLQIIDQSSGTKFKAIDFTFLLVADNVSYFHGHLTENGQGSYPFVAMMEDNGSPGKDNDRFYIDIQIGDNNTVFDEVIDNGNIVVNN